MLIFVNDRFVREEEAVVSVFDRGFLFGDGLFETMRVLNGRVFRWADHLERLTQGAEFLKIRMPHNPAALKGFADQLIERNRFVDGMLRLILSRGPGKAGYSPAGADRPTLVLSLLPGPEAKASPEWKLILSSRRLPAGEALARFKNCNKLPQILARAEAEEAGANEAVLLNTDGYVVEGAASNLFWIQSGTICTPPLTGGILAGVTRLVLFEVCQALRLPVREAYVTPTELKAAGGVFVSLSSWGVVEAVSLDGQELSRSPLVGQIQDAYNRLLQSETAGTESMVEQHRTSN